MSEMPLEDTEGWLRRCSFSLELYKLNGSADLQLLEYFSVGFFFFLKDIIHLIIRVSADCPQHFTALHGCCTWLEVRRKPSADQILWHFFWFSKSGVICQDPLGPSVCEVINGSLEYFCRLNSAKLVRLLKMELWNMVVWTLVTWSSVSLSRCPLLSEIHFLV